MAGAPVLYFLFDITKSYRLFHFAELLLIYYDCKHYVSVCKATSLLTGSMHEDLQPGIVGFEPQASHPTLRHFSHSASWPSLQNIILI